MPPGAAALLTAAEANANGYSTREAAAAVGLTPTRVRGVVRRGLLSPGDTASGYRFSFQDVVALRTVKGLLDALPAKRTFAALAQLRADRQAPLSALRVCAVGGHVAVQEAAALWDAQTGQGHLPLAAGLAAAPPRGEVRALAQVRGRGEEEKASPKAAAATVDAGRHAGELDSDDWYNVALDLEESDPDKAPAAYGRALVANPKNADAHVNLGRLFQVDGDLKRATRHYQLALHAVPKHQLALYNLGTVFDELDELDAAVGYYRRAVQVPDAHYNLARIFELRGDEVRSLRHMRKYRLLSARGEG